MKGQPIAALSADSQALLQLCRGFNTDSWDAPSGCPGWSTKDLVSHLSALYWMVVDPSKIPATAGLGTEEAQEVLVRSRATMTPDEVLEDYESVSRLALEALEGMLEAEFELPLGDLGTYPASAIPNAFCFDHYTHIRYDLCRPRGSLAVAPPESDELRLVPALDWIEAALPQQNSEILAQLETPTQLIVTGPAGRTIALGPPGDPTTRVRSDAPSTVRWITQRATWDDVGAEVEGDEADHAVLRKLRVF